MPGFSLEKVLARRLKQWNTPKAVWVGRISLEKRLDFILKSFAILSSRISQAHMVVVGDGSYKDEAMELSQKLGVSDHIKWIGYRKNVMPFLLRGHVFLHACLSEEFGYTIAESMATGLPVIAYDCPYGPREILEGGRYGILVKTEEEMADATYELFTNPGFWLDISKKSFERAKNFDIEKISRQYVETFKAMLK
ncbi:MAG: glycosyltransferase [Syntrophobacterales bacterium]|nr:glycosyltransferase [Syntrophobacterales bacterium]